MSLPRFILKQLAHPAGILGRLILSRLNNANRGMNEISLRSLPVSNCDHALEIGFGGGDLLDMILRAGALSVDGVETSDLAVNLASDRHRQTIDQGALKLFVSDAASMPFENERFSKVYCVNVVYFWPDPDKVFREINRVMTASGQFALCYQTHGPDQDARFDPLQIEQSLLRAGFVSVETTSCQDKWNGRYFCTIAGKSAATGSGLGAIT